MSLELIIMVGAAGTGKTTHAQKHAKANGHIWLSSDHNRARLGTSESDLTVSKQAFKLMEKEARENLAAGRSVIIDATFTTPKARAPFVKIGREFGAKIIAHCMQTSLAEAKKRNNNRERVVPEFVIVGMFNKLELPTIGEVDEISNIE